MDLPQLDHTPAKLYQMRRAAISYQLLMTGMELAIFDCLAEPQTADQVAETIAGHPKNTLLFLNALTGCGLLVKKQGRFQNTPLARTFLVQNSPACLGRAIQFQDKMMGPMLKNLSKLILEGPPEKSPATDLGSEKRWQNLTGMLADTARAGMAQLVSGLVSELPEFPGFKKILDLGGGPGIFTMAMVSKHPDMTGVVFDRQPVVDIALDYIKAAGMANRVSVLAGDFNTDPIGEGYDLIWASSTLNFAGDNLPGLMDKIYQALAPQGVFISFSEGLTQEGTSPSAFVITTLAGFMTGAMHPFNQGEIAHAMLDAGFRSVRSRTIPTCSSWEFMDMDIARK